MNPKVDIIMSVYNGEKYLEEMLTSLEQQTYANWQLIVRNNGSTDKTSFLLEKFNKNIEATPILVVDFVVKF